MDQKQLLRKHRREQSSLKFQKYLQCYVSLLNDIEEIDRLIRAKADPVETAEKWNEILVSDAALYHLYCAEEKNLRAEQVRERQQKRSKSRKVR